MGGDRDLSKPVVHLVGDAAAFLLLRPKQFPYQILQRPLAILEFLVEAGILQRTRRLAGKTVQYLNRIVVGQRFRTVRLENTDNLLPNLEWQA